MFGFLTSGTKDTVDPLVSVRSVSQWLRSLPVQDVIGRQQLVLGAFEMLRQPRKAIDPPRVQAVLFLDAALGADRRQLVKQYVENADSGTQLSQRIWQAAFDLAQGYIGVYQQARAGSRAVNRQSALEQLLPYCSPGSPTISAPTPSCASSLRLDSIKWVEFHSIYMRAVELERPRADGARARSQHNAVDGGAGILRASRHQLNTGNMSPTELDWRCTDPRLELPETRRRRWASSSMSAARRIILPGQRFRPDAALPRHHAVEPAARPRDRRAASR
jgi:hypothetical protein